jgi:hypothetical protein
MTNQDYGTEASQNVVAPMNTIEKIADSQAFELWGENIGRGVPIPLYDTNGLYAYVVPYIRGAKQFPPDKTLFKQLRALRKDFEVSAGSDDMPASYYSALRQMGNGFGSVCVSARYTDGPILWMSHFLAPYFIIAESAQEEAKRRLGRGKVRLSKYYYFSPEEQYMEFASGAHTHLVNASAPGRSVPKDALTRRSSKHKPEEIASRIRESWVRLTAIPSTGMLPEDLSPKLAPGADITPKGLLIDDIAETHTEKKMAYWELIPIVDHTPKNWCVPTSWAMILGFYDNFVKGKGTLLGYGRLIDYWYELTPGGFNLPNLIDDLLSSKAATINNYSFPETKTNGDHTQQWDMLKGEIDAGRPCFFNIPGHVTAAFGYRVNNNGVRFAIVYDPPNPKVPTYVNEYNLLDCTGIGKVTLGGGTDGENLILSEPDGGETFYTSVPDEIIWFVWGNSIQKTRLSMSLDGGNSWQTIADNVATKCAWNGYAWLAATPGTRVRIKVEGLTAGNVLVAADGSYKNLEVKSTPSGTGWKKIWGPTSTVIASSVSWGKDVMTYAVPLTNDGIYRYDKTPMVWTKIGGPGKMFALDDTAHLYGLSPDGSGIYCYDGSPMKWTQVGGPAGAIYAGGNSLFATNSLNGDLYEYQGTPMKWAKIGGPGKLFAVDRKGRIYGVSPDGNGVYRYDGVPMAWTKIADQASAIYAGGCGLYIVSGANKDIYCFHLVPYLWTKVGGPGKMFAVDDFGRLFGLSPDGSAVMRYDGAWNAQYKWTKVGGAAGKIFAGGNGRLFATNPKTNDLMSYE